MTKKKLKTLIEIKFKEKVKDSTTIEVLHAGEWDHAVYGTISITEADIDKFIQNFDDKTRTVDIAVDQEHQPEKGAAGWFKSLKKVFEDGITKLKATIEWTDLGKELLNGGVFKYFSPEFDYEYEDPETHEVFQNVLMGGGLTNRPYFKSLAPVTMSENMLAVINNYEEKGKEMLTKKELKVKLAEDSSFKLGKDASDAEKKLFAEAEKELADEAKKQESGDKKEDESEDEKETETAVEGSEKFISESEHTKQMNEVKTRLGVAEKKLRFKEVEKVVHGFVFSESNQSGVLLTKNEKVAKQILMSASDKVAKLFTEFLGELPKVSAKLFKEEGGAEGDTSGESIHSKVLQLMEDKKLSNYSEATKLLQSENPDLFK